MCICYSKVGFRIIDINSKWRKTLLAGGIASVNIDGQDCNPLDFQYKNKITKHYRFIKILWFKSNILKNLDKPYGLLDLPILRRTCT